jgi:multidrug transporter EmrE-like cation transporter
VASLKNHLPSFVVATWVMASIVIAIAYALFRGTAEAVAPQSADSARRT